MTFSCKLQFDPLVQMKSKENVLTFPTHPGWWLSAMALSWAPIDAGIFITFIKIHGTSKVCL